MAGRTVDGHSFRAWRQWRAVVDAESAPQQAAVFEFCPESRDRAGVWLYGGPGSGIRIGAVWATTVFGTGDDGRATRRREYTAVADAAMFNGTVSPAAPVVTGFGSRREAAALLYGRWIERRARGCAEPLVQATRQPTAATSTTARDPSGAGSPT